MSRISRMALSQERSFCRLWWKLHSISSSAALNSGPRQPLKMGMALCWPSSQRANWCWQSQTWQERRQTLTSNTPIKSNITNFSIWWQHSCLHSCAQVRMSRVCKMRNRFTSRSSLNLWTEASTTTKKLVSSRFQCFEENLSGNRGKEPEFWINVVTNVFK